MIHEIAQLQIDPAKASAFEAAVGQAVPQFRAAPGCLSLRLERVIENPGQYLLIVGWKTVEAHMVDFRESPRFQVWRDLASPFFTAPPSVTHIETAIDAF